MGVVNPKERPVSAVEEFPTTPLAVVAPARRVRVAHVNANFFAGAGGIMLRQAAALDRERYQTSIVAPADSSLMDRARSERLHVVPLHKLRSGRRAYPGADLEAIRELRDCMIRGGYDVVHTHGAKAGLLARFVARRVGVPAVVHTLHGLPFHDFQSVPARRGLLELERRMGRVTDWFMTDGTFVAAQAVRLGIAPPDRIRAVVSPIDPIPAATPASRRKARALLEISQAAKVIGTTGRLAAQKAPLDMARAVADLGRTDVVMVWLGDGEMRGETERLIARLGIADRFLLPGNRDDVARLLPAFDVFAMSSLFEGLPCAVVEAMTCGIPVVATAVNSVPELVIPGRTGLTARPGDPRSLSLALTYMLEHPDEAARMATAAAAHVREQFRPEAVGRETAEVYDSALRFPRKGVR
jgi:glycosyltransferase involved in cell wall biosynthesis